VRVPFELRVKLLDGALERRRECGQGQNRTADTRIFSSDMVPGLSVTIGGQLNEFNRLKVVAG
jgi:hypothetical protein